MSEPSKTPQTDAFEVRVFLRDCLGYSDVMEACEFARKIELENYNLRKALASSCDEERSLAISEGGGHGMCGLASELTLERDDWKTCADRLFAVMVTAQDNGNTLPMGDGVMRLYASFKSKYGVK